MKRINGSLLMGHQSLACALVYQREIGKTPARSDVVLHHAPEACNGSEVVPTMGGEKMAAELAVVVIEGRIKLVCAMDPAAIHAQHDVLAGFAEGGHAWMEILASLLRIKVGHDCREDFRGAVLDRADDAAQHPAGEAAPRALPHPRVAFAGLLAVALPLAQWPCQEASTLGGAPPARPEQGTAPQDRFICIEQNDFATACLILQGGEFERAIGEISRGGNQSTSGAREAQRVFFKTQRTLSRPSWTPVSRAQTVASARQRH